MLKYINRHCLTAAIWFLFGICSLSWWRKIASLGPNDYPIWWPAENASFLPGAWMFFAIVATCLSALYIIEVLNNNPLQIKQIMIWVSIFGLGAILVYPLGAKDIFNYISTAHLYMFYGLNPHLVTVNEISYYQLDPFLKNVFHITVVSPYGPLWTWLSCGLYYIVSGFGLIPLIISFKVLGLIMHLLITFTVYKVSEVIAEGNGSRAAIIYGMNPLAIFELVANAHNDGPAILLLLISVYLLIRKCTLIGFITLGTAVSFKFTAILTVPFLILYSIRERGPFFAGLGAAAIASIVFLFYLISKVDILNVIQNSAVGFINYSFPSLFYAIAGENIVPFARTVGLIIFFFWSYALLRRQIGGGTDNLNISIGLCFIAYLLFGAYMVHRWYYLWPLALTSASSNNPWTKAVVIQTIILLPCYTLTLAFGEVNIDKSITYLLALLPILITGFNRLHHRQIMG